MAKNSGIVPGYRYSKRSNSGKEWNAVTETLPDDVREHSHGAHIVDAQQIAKSSGMGAIFAQNRKALRPDP